MQNCVEIIKNLYVGNIDALQNEFDFIVNCTKNVINHPNINSKNTLFLFDEKYKDGNFDPVNNYFLCQLINKTNILNILYLKLYNRNKVLILCKDGDSVSCAVTACYLMKMKNYSSAVAIEFIKEVYSKAFSSDVYYINAIYIYENILKENCLY